MENTAYISVILPLKLEWEPCYAVSSDQSVHTGDRVKVVFSNKEYVGVVSGTGITPDINPKRILPIVSIEKDLEKVLTQEIGLWRQIAEYYLCTIGEVYKAAYPATKISLEESRAAHIKAAQERKAKLLKVMSDRIRKIEDKLAKKETLLESSRNGTRKRQILEESLAKIKKELENASAVYAAALAGEAEGNRKGNDKVFACDASEDISLSDAQSKAYQEIKQGFQDNKPVMLHGITGSGKTEIYIKLAQEVIAGGRNVLYMVPEIALSRQLEERLEKHFADRLLVFHSGESAVSKRNTAEAIRNSNGGYIVLGTRSSLFLPHHDLGLIVVDEEHDSSYKQDSPAPRYNGRDTALMMSRIQKCNIILGSATPSYEEIYNCQTNKHLLVTLNERYYGSEDAEIEIVDTRAERRKRGMEGNFSRKLIGHIKQTLAEGGQIMILRSRRAWAPALQCEKCGDIPKCPHCNVSLTYHKDGSMVCHYCGHTATYTGTCAKCHGQLKGLGAGTQKIEEEAAALFPEANIARLDSDTAQNKTYETKVIKEFSQGKINIIIGTQMLAKGFDFSNLRLVAVIAADTMLGLQDFRADEKAVQLLEQFRGRSGRRGTKGLCVIQTSQPEHPVYKQLIEGVPINGYMMAERHDFNFPPFTRIIEITFRDAYESRAERMSANLAASLRAITGHGSSILDSPLTGPYKPVVDKIADQYIRTIRISLKKDRNLKTLKNAVMEMVSAFEKKEKYTGHISIDVDPA